MIIAIRLIYYFLILKPDLEKILGMASYFIGY